MFKRVLCVSKCMDALHFVGKFGPLCDFQSDFESSGSTRPFPFPVGGVMEKGNVPFLCLLQSSIKMLPACIKEPPFHS